MDNVRDPQERRPGAAGIYYDEMRKMYPLADVSEVVKGLATVVGERLSFFPDPVGTIAEIADTAEITLEESDLRKLLVGMLARMDPSVEEEQAWDEALDLMRAAGANIPEPESFEIDEERLADTIKKYDDLWAARLPEQVAIDKDAFSMEQAFMSVINEPEEWHPLVAELSAAIAAADPHGRTLIGVEVLTIALEQSIADTEFSLNNSLEIMLVWACRGRRPSGMGGGGGSGGDDPERPGPLPETHPEHENAG